MSSWPETRIRYLADINPRVPEKLLAEPTAEVSFLPMEAIGEGGAPHNLERTRPVAEVRNGYSYFADGDVVFAKVTPCFENGKGGVVQGLQRGAGFGTTELTVLRPREGVDARFLNYLLQQAEFRQAGVSSMLGAGGLKRIPDDFVRDFKVSCPSPSEQERIANFLDEQTARIDALIAEKERLQNLLVEYRSANITTSVTEGASASGELIYHPLLGRVPKAWRIGRLRRYIWIRSGQVDPEDEKYSTMVLIAPNHVESSTGRLLTTETAAEQSAESGKYWCDVGDVIYSKIRPALRKVTVAPQDCLCSADMYPLKAHGGLTNEYLFWYLLSEPFSVYAEQESMRVAMPKVNREALADAPVPLPPVEEQREIARRLSQRIEAIDNLRAHAADHIHRLREYRSSLISAAVTGQLDLGAFHAKALEAA